MNRFFAFFVVSLLIHAIVGAVLISRTGILGGKGEEEAVEVNPVEENEEPKVEPVKKPVVKPKKVRKPPKPKKEKKKMAPKIDKKPAPVVKEVEKEKPVETPPPKAESVDKKPEIPEEEPQDESELIEPKKEEIPPTEPTEPPKEEDESELMEPEKEEVKPEEKEEAPAPKPAPKPLGSEVKKPSVLEIKQARSHSQLKQIKGNPLPVYPAEALKKKWEGRVEVIYYVNPGGFVEQIQLKQSSGHSALDNSALRALSRYRYHPGQEGWVQHPVEFFLEKGKEIKEVAPLGVPESE